LLISLRRDRKLGRARCGRLSDARCEHFFIGIQAQARHEKKERFEGTFSRAQTPAPPPAHSLPARVVGLVQEVMVQRAHHFGIQGRTIGPFVPVPFVPVLFVPVSQVLQMTAGVGAGGVAHIPFCAGSPCPPPQRASGSKWLSSC
jgi:hypothetical protein